MRARNLNRQQKANMGKTRTSKPKVSQTRFISHVCKPSEGNCDKCKDYINRCQVKPNKKNILVLLKEFQVYRNLKTGKLFLGYSQKKKKYVIKKWRKKK